MLRSLCLRSRRKSRKCFRPLLRSSSRPSSGAILDIVVLPSKVDITDVARGCVLTESWNKFWRTSLCLRSSRTWGQLCRVCHRRVRNPLCLREIENTWEVSTNTITKSSSLSTLPCPPGVERTVEHSCPSDQGGFRFRRSGADRGSSQGDLHMKAFLSGLIGFSLSSDYGRHRGSCMAENLSGLRPRSWTFPFPENGRHGPVISQGSSS